MFCFKPLEHGGIQLVSHLLKLKSKLQRCKVLSNQSTLGKNTYHSSPNIGSSILIIIKAFSIANLQATPCKLLILQLMSSLAINTIYNVCLSSTQTFWDSDAILPIIFSAYCQDLARSLYAPLINWVLYILHPSFLDQEQESDIKVFLEQTGTMQSMKKSHHLISYYSQAILPKRQCETIWTEGFVPPKSISASKASSSLSVPYYSPHLTTWNQLISYIVCPLGLNTTGGRNFLREQIL